MTGLNPVSKHIMYPREIKLDPVTIVLLIVEYTANISPAQNTYSFQCDPIPLQFWHSMAALSTVELQGLCSGLSFSLCSKFHCKYLQCTRGNLNWCLTSSFPEIILGPSVVDTRYHAEPSLEVVVVVVAERVWSILKKSKNRNSVELQTKTPNNIQGALQNYCFLQGGIN